MRKSFFKNIRYIRLLIVLSFNILLAYSMVLCLYISGIGACGVIESTELTSYCILILENIICALCITVITCACYLYNINKYINEK